MRCLAICVVLVASGCHRDTRPPPSIEPAHDAPQFVDVSFEMLYPTFLQYDSMPEGDKAGVWNRYKGRWVRWEGVIASVTKNGITLRQLLTTVTFDISLICDAVTQAKIRERFAVGDRVLYAGRLDSYDDLFRTLYLTHGVVIDKVAPGDLGVVPDMRGIPLP